eukprot:Colp12_sorted_trinity150504_noHs@3422
MTHLCVELLNVDGGAIIAGAEALNTVTRLRECLQNGKSLVPKTLSLAAQGKHLPHVLVPALLLRGHVGERSGRLHFVSLEQGVNGSLEVAKCEVAACGKVGLAVEVVALGGPAADLGEEVSSSGLPGRVLHPPARALQRSIQVSVLVHDLGHEERVAEVPTVEVAAQQLLLVSGGDVEGLCVGEIALSKTTCVPEGEGAPELEGDSWGDGKGTLPLAELQHDLAVPLDVAKLSMQVGSLGELLLLVAADQPPLGLLHPHGLKLLRLPLPVLDEVLSVDDVVLEGGGVTSQVGAHQVPQLLVAIVR